MARSRNRNNQGKKRPEEIEDTTDVEFFDSDDQVDVELSYEEEQASMSKEPSQPDDIEIDEAFAEGDKVEEADFYEESEQNSVTTDSEEAKKKGNNAVWYGVAAVLVAVAVGGVYYSNQGEESTDAPSPVNQSTADTNSVEQEATDTQVLENDISPLSTDEPVPQDKDTNGLASSDDVVEHQTGQEVEEVVEVEEVAATTDSVESDSVEAPAVDSNSTDETSEQEELVTAEQGADDVASIDESNTDTVPSSDVEEVEVEVSTAIAVPTEDDTVSVDDAITEVAPSNMEVEESSAEPVAQPTSPVISELEREFEVLTASQEQEIHRLQQELLAMQQHLQDTNESAESLLLNDVSRLLQSADNELRFNANVTNAVSILTVAQRLAAESKNRVLEGLVGVIGADIVALKSTETATTEKMFAQVQQLSTLIDRAPLNTPDYASHNNLMVPVPSAADKKATTGADIALAESDTAELAADARWYERSWNQTKSFASTAYSAVASDLGDLVRVEKLSEPDSGLLSADQAGIMRNNLKTQLGFAQQALMSRQQDIWQTSLTTVAQALDQYFRPDAAETTQAKQMIAELGRSSVRPTVPDISHSQRALSETYEQLRVQRSFQE